jgi:uncharacterized membrane protein YphA (DoxX/SURF4 family)
VPERDPSPKGSELDAGSRPVLTAAERGIFALRLSIGLVWALNLIFIFDPQNAFFATFAATAGSFAPVSLGGAGFPAFVAAHPMFFSIAIAAVTLYLALAFLLGLTTRFACLVGAGFALLLLISQFGAKFYVPGGTDVGPMPIYVATYVALALGGAERYLSLDAALSARGYWRRLGLPSVPGRPA